MCVDTVIQASKGTPAYEKSEDPIYVLENNIPIDNSCVPCAWLVFVWHGVAVAVCFGVWWCMAWWDSPSTGLRLWCGCVPTQSNGSVVFVAVTHHPTPMTPHNRRYYLENQLSKPLLRLFGPIMDHPESLLRGEHTRSVFVRVLGRAPQPLPPSLSLPPNTSSGPTLFHSLCSSAPAPWSPSPLR
jgi:hypothetical protein